jgi:hypothetical protein
MAAGVSASREGQYWVPRRLGGSAPSQRLQKYGTDGVTPPGKDQSGLH